MEHSEEYYKMKYFKYKAKYELLKGGDDEKKEEGFFSKKWNTHKENKKSAKSEIIAEARALYKKSTKLDPVWNKVDSFNRLLSEMKDLTFDSNTIEGKAYTSLHKEIIVKLTSLCKNTGRDSIDDDCKTEMK